MHLSSSDKSCAYINDECKEQIADCSLYEGTKASECEAIIPKDDPYSTKCVFKSNTCQAEQITSCEEFSSLLPKQFCNKVRLSNGGSCELVNNECKEYNHYSSCSFYHGDDKNTCESIELYDPYKYCSYEGNACVEKTRTEKLTCNSYKSGQDDYYCEKIKLEDSKKHCKIYDIFNLKCNEFYKKCSDYEGNDEIVCNSNMPEEYDKYKCVFKNGKCTEEKKICSDYKLGLENIERCEYIHPSEDDSKACEFIDNQCVEIDMPHCELYDGDENKCKSIEPVYGHSYDYSYHCVYTNGKCDYKKKTSCSDYKEGEGRNMCTYNIELSDEDKYCLFKNDKCIETYRQCSNYQGSDDSICNSIITEDGGNCEYKNDACIDKIMECSDYTSILDNLGSRACEEDSYPSDYNKKCVFSNYNCLEKDRNCLDFKFFILINKEMCEKAPTSSEDKKCVMANDRAICIEEDKKEEDVKIEEDKKEEDNKEDATAIKAFGSLLSLLLLLLL